MQQRFLFGTRNALHCQSTPPLQMDAHELWPRPDYRPDKDRLKRTLAGLAETKALQVLAGQDFDHAAFFSAYFADLADRFALLTQAEPGPHIEASFDALRTALERSVPALQTGATPVFKDPLASFRKSRLDWFFDTWPDGRAVFLRRNPYGRLWSRIQHDIRHGRADLRLSSDPRAFLTLSRAFARDHAESSRLKDDSRILLVQYEDLTSEPEHWLREICHFLGLDFVPSLLQSTCFGFPAQPTTNRTGSFDISRSSHHKWRDHLTVSEKVVMGYGMARAATRLRLRRGRA